MSNEYKIILAIETSCDETSAAVIGDGREVLSMIISSQILDHRIYGGVVPEVASRKHLENISNVVISAMEDADITYSDIDAIAVTKGPGLVGALLVGVSYAKGLAIALDVPLVGVHHIDGHISANYITHSQLTPPFMTLVVSGGHTLIAQCSDYGHYSILGQSRDDAAGEAFDKGARLLGLPYPGGKEIDMLAKDGDREAIAFPRAKLSGNDLDFSYSGVKTSLRQYIHKHGEQAAQDDIHNIAASYQEAVVDVMVANVEKALKKTKMKKLSIAGGVAANSRLRTAITQMCEKIGVEIYLPELMYCCDNAAMIGVAGYYMLQSGARSQMDLNAIPSISLEECGCF